MFDHAERTLRRVDFLKPGSAPHMMGVLREMWLRAGLDAREVAIWHGVFSQVDWAIDADLPPPREEE